MAVRVPIVVRSSAGRIARSAAVLNGGFEAARPQLLLPARFIVMLVPDYRRRARRRRYQAAGGAPLLLYELPGSWEAWVETRDREGVHAPVRILVSDSESELLPGT